MMDDNIMSNFDGVIPEGMEDRLRAQPNNLIGRHSGDIHYGYVGFDGKQFCEEVWLRGCLHDTLFADTLRELMDKVNLTYGGE